VSEIESSTPASTSARGPVGETRSVGLSILWFILNIVIYGIYWVYKTQEEVKRYSGNGVGGVLGIVIYILISPVTFFIVPSEVRYMYEDLDGGQSPVRGVTGLWFLLPIVGSIIWFVKVQGALNRYWESKGASPA
jgi:hypothetical protein